MKENKYDDPDFFNKYANFGRSKGGLANAGEWEELKRLLPDFTGKTVLDMGCGYGWHCIYAAEQGAKSVIGTDISEKMLETARRKTTFSNISYECLAMEDLNYPAGSFDVIISSLALHYVADLDLIYNKVYDMLKSDGQFIFSAEHPVFTASGPQQWHMGENGELLHWPVDHYFLEGGREAEFLNTKVTKYHRTLTSYINGLIQAGFEICGFVEPTPPLPMRKTSAMDDELRRPMMLIIQAAKRI